METARGFISVGCANASLLIANYVWLRCISLHEMDLAFSIAHITHLAPHLFNHLLSTP
jgi:hypothetical protein